jgi:S1-C subfamily serine protease
VPNSAADDAGLQKGDVIFEVSRKEISSVTDFKNAVSQNKDNAILLAVERQGNPSLSPVSSAKRESLTLTC